MTMSDVPQFVSQAAPETGPIPFDITALSGASGEQLEPERFTALAMPPAEVIESFASMVSIDDHGRQVWHRIGLLRFLRGCLIPADEQRWDNLVADKGRFVHLETLAEVAKYLNDRYVSGPSGLGGRPFSSGSSSPGGPSATGNGSRQNAGGPTLGQPPSFG